MSECDNVQCGRELPEDKGHTVLKMAGGLVELRPNLCSFCEQIIVKAHHGSFEENYKENEDE